MAVFREGSNIVVDASVAGSVFPTTEADLVYPVLVDGRATPVVIEGAVYGRALGLRGDVSIRGPVLARGDVRIEPGAERSGARVFLAAGLTVNGSVNCPPSGDPKAPLLQQGIEHASLIVKGDIAVNQNIALHNAIVFGSLRAVNCSLDNCLVLGTCIIEESLKVTMSSIGGYAARDVAFAGECLMLHAIGESATRPLFLPHQQADGALIDSDLRYYPAIRAGRSIINRRSAADTDYPAYSRLYPEADWVQADALPNPALDEIAEGARRKWILSIGGRVSDSSRISLAVSSLGAMLKCGFEYEHYHPSRRTALLERAMAGLTSEERWILQTVCA